MTLTLALAFIAILSNIFAMIVVFYMWFNLLL